MRKLKHSEVSKVRLAVLKQQDYKCPLCEAPLRPKTTSKMPALDHCHTHGHIRGVLCLNCNAMEGKVKTCATRGKGKLTQLQWLKNLVSYLEHHAEPQIPFLHPTHKTAEEKRLARNKKARDRRAKLKTMGK